MYSIWRNLVLILVPVLGLISCSRDKPDVRYVDDSWAVAAPEIHQDGRKVGGLAALESELINAPMSAELVFPSLSDQEPDVRMTFVSSCSVGQLEDQQSLETEAKKNIPFINLVPLRLVATPLQSDDLKCQIKVSVRNAIGSTRRFLIKSIKLDRTLPTSAKLGISAPFTQMTSIMDAVLPSKTQAVRSRVRVQCSSFENEMTVQGLPSEKDLHLVLYGELSNEALARFDQVDPRAVTPYQSCRIALEIFNSNEPLATRKVTELIPVEFPLKSLNIRDLGSELGRVYGNEFKTATLFSATIENPNQAELSLRVPLDPETSLELTPIVFRTAYYTHHPVTSRLNWTVSNARRQWTDQGYLYFVVGRGETVVVSAKSDGTLVCSFAREHQAQASALPANSAWMFAGFAYRFKKEFPLELIINSDSAANSSQPEAQFIWGKPLAGWIPQEYWVQQTGGPQPTSQGLDPLLHILRGAVMPDICRN